jgi:uncharacterized protein (DUF1501 family)
MRAWFAGEIAAAEFDEGERRLALNPAMPNLHRLYQAGQGIVVYAVASPYRERSHFNRQDVQGLRPADQVLG